MSIYDITLQGIISQVKRQHQYWNLGGGDLEEGQLPPYDSLLVALYDAIEEVNLLKQHQCQYDERDYCIICGNDGRA